jgi:hypothetical protein
MLAFTFKANMGIHPNIVLHADGAITWIPMFAVIIERLSLMFGSEVVY